jgi:hypothetical protein
MTDHGFVCHECGRTFRGINARIGVEMCPQCGSIDIARTAPAAHSAPARPDEPGRRGMPVRPTRPTEQTHPPAAEGPPDATNGLSPQTRSGSHR